MIIENNFGIFFILSIILGLLIPDYTSLLSPYVYYIIMLVLFLIFLKIDLQEILGHIKKPMLILYILLINIIIFPIVLYFLSFPFDKEIIIGILLLTSLPTGTAAAALTDIIKGKTSLTLVLAVLSSLITPLTIPTLFYILLKTKIQLDYSGLLITLFKLVFIPLISSELIKLFFKNKINNYKKYFGSITIILAAMIPMAVIGKEADYILSNPLEILYLLVILYVLFFIYQLMGYYMVFWLKKDEKIAVSNSKTFMNSALGIVIALEFLNPKVALFLVLSEIPWSTMLIVFRWYKDYLR